MVENGIFFAKAMAMLGAAIAMGLGTIGPALGQGMIGAKALECMGKDPASASKLRAPMILALAFVETAGVFAFAIAVMLIQYNR